VFSQWNEQVGAGQGAVRAAPAQQGFGAHAIAAVEVEYRLIQHLQLAPSYRALEFGVQ